MRFQSVMYMVIMLLVLSLVTVGCAPKNPADQTSETSPAGQPAGPAGATAPGASGPEGAQAGQQAGTAAQAGFDKKVYFDYDKFDLSPEAIQTLTGLVDFLKANPDFKVQVGGNTDERGTTEYNMALGDKRARSAKEYCVTQGIDEKRITTVSYGEEKPVDPAQTEDAWSKNRRDEFLFSK